MNAKRFTHHLLTIAVATLGATAVHAKADPIAETVGVNKNALPYGLSDEQVVQLSEHVLWRRLLMFSDAPKNPKKDSSLITDDEFFLSKSGKSSPKDELVAMLSAMARGDDEAMCRFPARTRWLGDELDALGINVSVSDVKCADFHAWVDDINAMALSLVFAEEHGNNIGSAFAHAFMRIDGRADDEAGVHATAMNYTVASDSSDGALAAAIKPIIGKYQGVMEILPYQVKAHDYLVKDERDLWEYRLNLSDLEVDQIMRHIWEVRDLKRPYYLTHDNCATEIARLVDVVRADEALFSKLGMVTTPAKVAQLLSEEGLVERVRYQASNSTKRQVIINNGDDFDLGNIQPNNNNPTKASPSHRIGAAASYDGLRDDEMAYHISLRTAYQDALDNPAGVRKFHQLTLPSIDISYQDDKIKLHELSIFEMTSLNPANTAKAYPDGNTNKKALASQIYLGLHRTTDASSANSSAHLVLDAHTQKGKAWTIGRGTAGTGDMADTVCYLLGGGGAQLGHINQGYRVGVRATAGCIHHAAYNLRVMGELSVPYWYHKDSAARSGYVQPELSLGAQYDFDRHHALRLKAAAQKNHSQTDHSARLEFFRYF